MGKFSWGILNKKKAKKHHIEVVNGFLIIDIACMPPGMTEEEYIRYIEEEGIVWNYATVTDAINRKEGS